MMTSEEAGGPTDARQKGHSLPVLTEVEITHGRTRSSAVYDPGLTHAQSAAAASGLISEGVPLRRKMRGRGGDPNPGPRLPLGVGRLHALASAARPA